MTTEEAKFQEERRTGIGGSDVHHLFNLEPWGCALRLWYEKRGIPADYPVDDAGPIRRGRILEPLIADEFAEQTGYRLVTAGIARHPRHPFLMVHVDRLIADPPGGVLEIKCVGREALAKYRREGLPPAYILQLQHAMLVNELQWGMFAVFHADSWKLLKWKVEGDNGLWAEIAMQATRFWTMVENGPAPPKLPVTSKQCLRCPYRLRCHAAEIDAKLAEDEGRDPVMRSNDTTLALLASDYVEASDMVNEAEELKEGIKARIQAYMGGITAVEVPGARIYYRPAAPGFTWNTEKLIRHLGGSAEAFQKPKKPSRPLRVYAR